MELKQIEEEFNDLCDEVKNEEKKLNEADQAYYNMRNELSAKESELAAQEKEKKGGSFIKRNKR